MGIARAGRRCDNNVAIYYLPTFWEGSRLWLFSAYSARARAHRLAALTSGSAIVQHAYRIVGT